MIRGRRGRWTDFLAAMAVTFTWALFVFPLVWLVVISFQDRVVYGGTLMPSGGISLVHYKRLWHETALPAMAWNSILVTTTVVVCQVITSVSAGYVFARVAFRGRELLFWLFLLGMAVPDQLTLIPSFYVLQKIGLIDTYGALTLPFAAGGLGVLIMRHQFLSLPPELEEAGLLDGCTSTQVLLYVLVPSVTAGIRTIATLMFLFSWSNLLWPLVMTHSPGVRTLAVGVALLHSEWQTEWNLLAAGAVISALPVLIVVGLLSHGLSTFSDRWKDASNDAR